MNLTIKKFKLRDDMFGTVEYDKAHDTATDQIVQVCNNPVHDDLKERLQSLAVHCLLICELVDVTKIKGDLSSYRPTILDFIRVKSLTISNDEAQGVTISFERKLSTGKILNMNTPFTKYNDESSKYKFDNELQVAVGYLEEEIIEYLEGDKFGAGVQMEMEFPEAGESDDLDHV